MPEAVLHLSSFVGSPLLDSSGERLGRVEDVIVRLDAGDELPPVTGLKARIGGREMFVPADRIAHLEQPAARASTTKLNLAQFERRPGEVLLRADLLGRSVINVATARLVRAREVELVCEAGIWRVAGIDQEIAMFIFVFANLLVIPLLVLAHPGLGEIGHHFVVPGIEGGVNSTSVLLIIAMVGTTVAPWQLFFQQSNIIDKRITPRWINYERLDTWIGAFIVVIGAAALIAVSAFAFQGTPYFGHFTNAGATATGLDHVLGPAAGALFAVVLLNASLIGAGALTLSTSYAFGDMTGVRSSLHRSVSDAKLFYGIFAALIAGAAAIVLIPGAPLGVITLAVQALAGVLLPSASVFLLLLCNDREVLGPWRNATWLNVLASVIVSVLVLLSLILMATTIFPRINVTTVMLGGGIALAVGLVGFGFVTLRSRQRARAVTIIDPTPSVPKEQWTMPPLALLARPEWSTGRKLAMLTLRSYLVASVILLIVKAVQLGGG